MSRETKTTTVTGFVDEMAALEALGISKSQAFRDGCKMHIQANTKSLSIMETELHLLEAENRDRQSRMEFIRQAIENTKAQSIVTSSGVVIDKETNTILKEFLRCADSIIYDKKMHLLTHLSKASGISVQNIKTFFENKTSIPSEEELLEFIKG